MRPGPNPLRSAVLLFASLISVPFFLTIAAGMTDSEDGAPSRTRLALRQLVARADSGDAKALYDLATLHDVGYDSIPVDSARSTELYLRSAEEGYAPAQNYIGFRFYKGESVERDVKKGLEWMERAAIQGDPKAANNLGWLLLEGEGLTHDAAKAAFWLKRAADAGLPAGQAQYADLLRTGQGVPTDTLKADSLYRLAIEGGLRDAEAKLLSMQRERWRTLSPKEALSLGMYHYAHRAPAIGLTLFGQIEKQTDSIPANCAPSDIDSISIHNSTTGEDSLRMVRAHALALLGDAYTRALGVSYDHDLALRYFTEAALLGNPSAQFIIGELLEIFPDTFEDVTLPPGIDLKSLPKDAGWWFDRAAEAGVTDATQANRLLLALPTP